MPILKLPPQALANEASMLGCTGRMRQLLIDMNNSKIDDADFRQWHDGYFTPLLLEIYEAWDNAGIVSRTGNFPGNAPPWFDATPDDWRGAAIKYPPGLHKGAKMSFAFRLGVKGSFTNNNDFLLFEDECTKARVDCQDDTFWDDRIIWP